MCVCVYKEFLKTCKKKAILQKNNCSIKDKKPQNR